MLWIRTCRECGFTQLDKEPKGEMTSAYRMRKCKRCKSESLDYGSYRKTKTEQEKYPDEYDDNLGESPDF